MGGLELGDELVSQWLGRDRPMGIMFRMIVLRWLEGVQYDVT